MNYKIIADEKKLQEFVEFLPDLGPNEKFYFSLIARKKYWPTIKADKGQLARGTVTKDNLIDKIRQLECRQGSYKFEGHKIPNKALAFYIMPNPRDLLKATKGAVKKLLDLALGDNQGYNPHQEVMSEIQRSKAKTYFLDFDFDKPINFDNFASIVNIDAVTFIKTRGGHHVLISPDKVAKEFKHTFYKKITALGSDVTGDCLLPVPGTYQGGAVVEML